MKLSEQKIRDLVKIEKKASSSNSLYGVCPWCNHNEFGISLEKNHVFNCFRKKACGITGNIYDLLKFLGKSSEFIKFEKEIEKLNRIEVEKEEVKLKEYKLPLGYKRVFKDKYLESRGFTPEDFEKYEVGVSTIFMKGYVIFPVELNGEMVGHVGRSIYSKEYCENKDIKRYKNSLSNISKTLYNVEDIGLETIITEGVFDKIAVDKKLNKNCVTTFGAKISDDQIHLLKEKGCEVVTLCFDPDVLEIINKVAARLSNYFQVYIMNMPEGKDPDDCTPEELKESFRNRESFINFTKIKRL